MNTIANTTKPKTTTLQLPKETVSLIKASIADNTLKAYLRARQSQQPGYSVEPSPMPS